MTRTDIIHDIAELIVGLQVPVSLSMPLGAAREPWSWLFSELAGFGWTDVETIEKALTQCLTD